MDTPTPSVEPEADTVLAKLFVGGLSWQVEPQHQCFYSSAQALHPSFPQTNQERLRDYFAQFGDIEDVLIMRDPVTQVSASHSP